MIRLLIIIALLAGCNSAGQFAPFGGASIDVFEKQSWVWTITIIDADNGATTPNVPTPTPPAPGPVSTCLCGSDPAFPCTCTGTSCMCGAACKTHGRRGISGDETPPEDLAVLSKNLDAALKDYEEARNAKRNEPAPKAPATGARSLAVGEAVVNGVVVDVNELIRQWYKTPWRINTPGKALSDHLVEHGVRREDVNRMSVDTQTKLHSALHERDKAAGVTDHHAPPAATQSTTPGNAVQMIWTGRGWSWSSCPGGVCPAPTSGRRGKRG